MAEEQVNIYKQQMHISDSQVLAICDMEPVQDAPEMMSYGLGFYKYPHRYRV